jgi:hypothetical protein
MNQDLPPPPPELRPWYYQNLFLVVAFVLWPAWPILILRSPWNHGNFGIISGGVAWMVLIVGSVAIFLTVQAGRWDLVVLIVPPGIVLTVALQVFWASYKKRYLGPYLPRTDNGASEAPAGQESARSQQRATSKERRRRSRSRRSSRS